MDGTGVTSTELRVRAEEAIRRYLADTRIEAEEYPPGGFFLHLPGTHKPEVGVHLLVRERTLLVECFVMRAPEDAREDVYRVLLRHNSATYGLRYVLDELGDIFLMGAVPLEAVSEDEVDRLMGCAITYADEVFPALVNIGFATAGEQERRFRERLAPGTTA